MMVYFTQCTLKSQTYYYVELNRFLPYLPANCKSSDLADKLLGVD